MGSEVLLKSACQLSYRIARDGIESEPSVDPPAAMRSFLYVADLPDRALTVAQQAIEDDPGFRRRVAEQATEREVGRAGYLWLHRPIGWAAEFEELADRAETGDEVLATVPAYSDSDLADDLSGADDQLADDRYGLEGESRDRYEAGVEVPAAATSALGFGSIDALANGDRNLELSLATDPGGRSEANAIEDELSSLRGLVDRLSSERKAVSTSVRRVEQEVETSRTQPSMFDSDIYTLQSELEAARVELDAARAERDNAVRQHSESLTRQLELERELDRSRELRAEIEREHADVDASIVLIQEEKVRAEASLANIAEERDTLSKKVADLTATNERLSAEVAGLSEDRATEDRARQADLRSLQAEADSLRSTNDDLTSKLATVESELTDAKAQLNQIETQATEAKSLVDALTEEKIDLASRLADTEAMLETARTQLAAVKSDSEAVTADLSNIKAHRDGLAVQVDELHGSLSEALSDLARVRSTSDADRAALKEVRAERDLLRVRVGSLEQIETGLEAKLSNLASERDSLSAAADQAQADLITAHRDVRDLEEKKETLTADLASAAAAKDALTAERDELKTEIEGLNTKVAELEVTGDGLRSQVEQLTEENSSIQAQLVESDRLRSEAAETQGHALSELAQRLSAVENERSRLEADLREAEGRLSEALVTLEAARDEAERIRRLDVASAPGTETPTEQPPTVSESPSVLDQPAVEEAEPELGADEEGDEESAESDLDTEATVLLGRRAVTGEVPATGDEPEAEVEDRVEAPSGRGRSGRRPWGIGALRRGEGRGEPEVVDQPPPPTVDDVIQPVETGVGSDDAAEVAAALAETMQEKPKPIEVSDDEIDTISSELSEAVGDAALEHTGEEEDLDEISNLISQTVTDFDPKTLEGSFVDDDDDAGVESSAAPSLFASRDDEGDLPTTGGLPPSVFSGADDPDDDGTSVLDLPVDEGDLDSIEPDDDADEVAPETGRRRIEIPAEVADDEVEMARHVVSSPDVVLLVDGDSVAKMGWPSLPVAQQRDALVSYLADLSATTGAAPDVVFDGRIGEEESLPSSRAVRIRLSTPPTEPSAALDELVDAYPAQWPIAVVTDEDDLGGSAAERGAVVLSNGQLLDLFIS